MKIFIDVGGHFGETVEAVLDPIYAFDRIYSFEPVKECAKIINSIKDNRLQVIEAGLYCENIEKEIFKPGSEAASIYSDHEGLSETKMRDKAFQDTETCKFIKATDFFKENINKDDYVVMKLNCEGSECDILLDLINSKEILKVKNLLVDFDARKIPSQIHKIDIVVKHFVEAKINYYSPEEMQYGGGTHFGGIRQWLRRTSEKKKSLSNVFMYIVYHCENILHKRYMPFYKLQILNKLPKFIVSSYYKFK